MKRRLRGSARLADVEPDMNVTPLVDICLVLLVIFMVVTPRMNDDIQVDLPGIFNPDPDIKSTMDPIKISVPRAGEYYLDDQLRDLDGLVAQLTERHTIDPYRKLVLRADTNLRYGDVRPLLARAQEIGFAGASFLVGRRHKEGEDTTGTEAPAAPAPPANAESAAPAPPAAGEPAPQEN